MIKGEMLISDWYTLWLCEECYTIFKINSRAFIHSGQMHHRLRKLNIVEYYI